MKAIMAAALALAAAPAAGAERRYSVTDFDRVQVEGPYEVRLITGQSSSAVATGDRAGIERLSLEVTGRTLRIRANRSAWGGYPGDRPGPVTISLTTRDLRGAQVVGPGSLGIDRARGLRLDLAVSGSGALTLGAADADTLTVGLLGSGRIAIGGKARQLRATIQGSGDFDGRALRAEDGQVTADTAGAVAVGVARTAQVNAIGPGTVDIIGSAQCTLSGPAAAMVRCGP